MSRPKASQTRISEANSGKILDAALTIFAKSGLQGARLDRIAEQAEMSKPNLLYYFHSKEELYRAVLRRTLDVWLENLKSFDPEVGAEESIRRYIAGKLAFSKTYPEASRLFALEIISGGEMLMDAIRGDLAEMVESKARTIRGWIAEGNLAPVEPYHLIFTIWATTQHYADFSAQIEALTGKTLEDTGFHEAAQSALEQIFLRGILPRG